MFTVGDMGVTKSRFGTLLTVCACHAGVADGVSQVTAWPSALTVVQSWDRNAMYQVRGPCAVLE